MLYLILAACAAIILWHELSGPNGRVALAVFMVGGAAVGTGDFLVHAIGHWYIYHPGLHPMLAVDGPLGLILADYLFVPALGCWVSARPGQAGLWRALGMSLLVVLIEEWFARTGAFEQRRWSVWYSVLLFPIYYTGLWWIGRFLRERDYEGWLRLLVIGSTATYLNLLWSALGGLVLGIWGTSGLLSEYSFPAEVLGRAVLHGLPWMVATLLFAWNRWGGRLGHYLGLAAVFYLWIEGLNLTGNWKNAAFWSPLAQAASLAALTYAVVWVDSQMEHGGQQLLR